MASLNHTVSGDRRNSAVVFLHGFMGSSSDWHEVTAALDARFCCIAVDLPGHGASLGLSSDGYTMEGAARSVLDVLDEVGVDQVAAVGYSMGGRLALYLALRYPNRLSGCFLESSSPGLEIANERARRRTADEEKAVRLENSDFREFLRDWYRQPLFAPLARNEALLWRTVETRLQNGPAELAKSLRGMGTGSQPSLWGELPGLKVPALAVAGDLDEKFVEISHHMEAVCPRMRAAGVPGAGHSVHAENPAPYGALLEAFLGLL